jgi:hypothetical protein
METDDTTSKPKTFPNEEIETVLGPDVTPFDMASKIAGPGLIIFKNATVENVNHTSKLIVFYLLNKS